MEGGTWAKTERGKIEPDFDSKFGGIEATDHIPQRFRNFGSFFYLWQMQDDKLRSVEKRTVVLSEGST